MRNLLLKNFFLKQLLLKLFFLFLTPVLRADSDDYFAELFGKDTVEELKEQGEIFRLFSNNNLPSLLPDIKDKDEVLRRIKEVKPTVGVEVLLYYDSAKYNIVPRQINMLDVYNRMRSVSTLKGVRFFSDSNQKTYTLFKEAYVINENNMKIPDPLVMEMPRYSKINVFFTDPFLGSYKGNVEYWMADNYLLMYLENTTYIWWLFLPVVEPRNTAILYSIYPYENKLVFYAFQWAKAFNLFGVVTARKDDMHERIVTIYNWLLRGINK